MNEPLATNELWSELAGDSAESKNRSRDAMLGEVRAHRRRRWMVAAGAGTVPLVAWLAFSLVASVDHERDVPRRRGRVVIVDDPPRPAPPRLTVVAISDEELLASFEGPIALVEKDGKSRLWFPGREAQRPSARSAENNKIRPES